MFQIVCLLTLIDRIVDMIVKDTMNIICATDDNYVPLCGIMLTSLFENNRDSHIDVYVLTKGLHTDSMKMFDKLLKVGRYNAEIHFCEINDDLFNNCPIRQGDHISLVSYYRFLIPHSLPKGLDKALYLDCDILINDSIKTLYMTDISSVALGVCEESVDIQLAKKNIGRLGYPVSWGYFNSGVMMVNVAYWLEHHIMDKLFDYVSENQDKCLYHDQDALNAVLGNQKIFLPHRYNVFTYVFTSAIHGYDKTLFLQERPAIIHYCTPDKPWDWYLPDYPFRKQWEHYRDISPWKHWRGNKPLKEKVRRRLIVWSHVLRGKKFNIYDDSWKKWDE